ncbi:MAG: hypothetical protein AABY22_29455, partial [Nanoarchaeota archaeon]
RSADYYLTVNGNHWSGHLRKNPNDCSYRKKELFLGFGWTLEEVQKICKDFLGFKIEQIEISVSDTHISFNSAGYNDCNRNVTASCIEQLNENDVVSEELDSNGIVFSNHSTKYKGTFVLKYFEHFIKATPLSEKVTIYFKKDIALMIRYNVVDVGDMSFILFPIQE